MPDASSTEITQETSPLWCQFVYCPHPEQCVAGCDSREPDDQGALTEAVKVAERNAYAAEQKLAAWTKASLEQIDELKTEIESLRLTVVALREQNAQLQHNNQKAINDIWQRTERESNEDDQREGPQASRADRADAQSQ